uniref:M20 metallopeptidase family protein n=1 Tax=Gorillibacterium massiliense TaxID=1280390 RepID=UPI000592AA60
LPMIEAGVLDGVDVIYGIHLWTPFPYGTVAGNSGAVMAAADDFELEIRGKGGHGGLPHKTIDSLVIGAHLTVNLQTIVSRSLNPIAPAVVTVGSLQAGKGFNVISENCLMKGTVRTFDSDTRELAKKRLEEIVEHTCQMFGAEYQFHYKQGYPPVVNDLKESERFREVAERTFGAEAVLSPEPIMAAEDFARYLERVPGCFMFVGAGGAGAEYAHHHPRFDIVEEAMKNAARLFVEMTLDYLNAVR